MDMGNVDQVFEFRPLDQKIHSRSANLIVGLLVIMMIVIAFSMFQTPGVESWNDVLDAFHSPKASVAHQADAASGGLPELQAKRQKSGYFWFVILVAVVYVLVLVIGIWLRMAMPKRYSLCLTDEALFSRFRLPFGMTWQTPFDWRIALHDIRPVELARLPVPMPPMSLMLLRIYSNAAPPRVLNPMLWALPGGPDLPELKLPGKFDGIFGGGTAWSKPENLAMLQAIFDGLPIVKALRARGVVLPAGLVTEIDRKEDLFASPANKLGIATGLALIVTSLVAMIFLKNRHLQFDFPVWLYALLCGGAVFMLWRLWQREAEAAPAGHRVLAAVLLAAGVGVASPMGLLLLNGLGAAEDMQQAFVVHEGTLKPTGIESGIGVISLPGKQSRLGWLDEGSELTLSVRRGLFGFWEYDDTALRQLADRQGIR